MIQKEHKVDFCVVGGGLAGICAAVSAARHGIKVVLIHDRPVLGGNASSEIRMHACGASSKDINLLETGILEEIMLENLYRNNTANYSVWDSVLFEKVYLEKNITLLLNCSCTYAETKGSMIKSVKAWQMTTETWHTVHADLFSDCSGDGILAPLSGAEYMLGREAASQFSESLEPEEADKKTMGLSCLIQARDTGKPIKFIPPKWAYKYETEEELHRNHVVGRTNFWWIELGGDRDSIHDTEEIRNELLKIAFGVWDHIKNYGDHGSENFALEWVGFLPGKRESRRYVGDYILNQNDVENRTMFHDAIAYGGWTLDDHHPMGFNHKGAPNTHGKVALPYLIPYRCLYSKNIDNLFFAGRNISATHAAISSTRVMATCAILGQAVGTAASLAIENGINPRGVYELSIKELQKRLMDDDCYIPWHKREISDLTKKAYLSASEGNPENVRNGIYRTVEDVDNGWTGRKNSWIEYSFSDAKTVRGVRLVFDSIDSERPRRNMPSFYPEDGYDFKVPKKIVKSFIIEAFDENDKCIAANKVENNYQRHVDVRFNISCKRVRFVPVETWGEAFVHIYGFEVY